jgi:endonuclease III
MTTRTTRSKRGTPIEIKEEEEEPSKKLKSSPIKETEEMGPKNWRTLYNGIKDFRKINNRAAVDTDGCDMLAANNVLPKTRRYQILCALQLSSQTKDQVNAVAMKNLRSHFGDDGFTCEAVLNVEADVLDNLICKVWGSRFFTLGWVSQQEDDLYATDCRDAHGEVRW